MEKEFLKLAEVAQVPLPPSADLVAYPPPRSSKGILDTLSDWILDITYLLQDAFLLIFVLSQIIIVVLLILIYRRMKKK